MMPFVSLLNKPRNPAYLRRACIGAGHLSITILSPSVPTCNYYKVQLMADLTEIEALKASMRGARRAADALAGIAARVEATDPHADIADADLDDLQRLTLANAVAAQALRGLVETMLKRRGKLATETVESGTAAGIDE
jgi:hypothetical protein